MTSIRGVMHLIYIHIAPHKYVSSERPDKVRHHVSILKCLTVLLDLVLVGRADLVTGWFSNRVVKCDERREHIFQLMRGRSPSAVAYVTFCFNKVVHGLVQCPRC